jgi:hypothetical protein
MTGEFSDPGKQRTRDFLEAVKQTITNPATRYDGWLLVRRPESVECITELGLTLGDVRDAILGLSVADYCAGPLADRDMPGDLWVFGKVMESREIYIKLKLARIGPVKRVRIVSFHFPREPLYYPYRPEEEKKGGT